MGMVRQAAVRTSKYTAKVDGDVAKMRTEQMKKLAGNNFANTVGNQIAIENKVKTEMQRLGISPLYTNYYILFAKNIAKKRGQERDVEFMKWYQRGMRHDWLRWIGKLAGEGRLAASRAPGAKDQENLTGFWSIEEPSGATLEDVSGTGNDMTLMGGASRVDGVVGNALNLSGAGQYARLVKNSTINNMGEVTWIFWLNFTPTGAEQRLINKEEKRLNLTAGRRLEAIFGAATQSSSSTCTAQVAGGVWQHIAMTYSDTGDRYIRVYRNAVEESYTTHTPAIGALTDDSGYNLCLGATASGASGYLTGMMDEVRIWPRVLTAAEIKTIYEAERPF